MILGCKGLKVTKWTTNLPPVSVLLRAPSLYGHNSHFCN